MKLHYYPETDSLYIELNAKPSEDSREIADGLVVDFDADAHIIGIDIDRASQKIDSYLLLDFVRGRSIHVVFSYDLETDTGYIVTAYIPDPHLWQDDLKTRRR